MQIHVDKANGYLPAAYSKFAADSKKAGRFPIESFPFTVDELPKGTKYLAWAFIDFDSIPVMGFAWIHWLAANYPVTGDKVVIPANLSQQSREHKLAADHQSFVQGENSSYSRYIETTDPRLQQSYIGPVPPDHDHRYTLLVWACAEKLPVQNGFFFNTLYHLANDQDPVILAAATANLPAQA